MDEPSPSTNVSCASAYRRCDRHRHLIVQHRRAKHPAHAAKPPRRRIAGSAPPSWTSDACDGGVAGSTASSAASATLGDLKQDLVGLGEAVELARWRLQLRPRNGPPGSTRNGVRVRTTARVWWSAAACGELMTGGRNAALLVVVDAGSVRRWNRRPDRSAAALGLDALRSALLPIHRPGDH